MDGQVPPPRDLHTAWSGHAGRTLQERTSNCKATEPAVCRKYVARRFGIRRFIFMSDDIGRRHPTKNGHVGRTLKELHHACNSAVIGVIGARALFGLATFRVMAPSRLAYFTMSNVSWIGRRRRYVWTQSRRKLSCASLCAWASR